MLPSVNTLSPIVNTFQLQQCAINPATASDLNMLETVQMQAPLQQHSLLLSGFIASGTNRHLCQINVFYAEACSKLAYVSIFEECLQSLIKLLDVFGW